MLQGSRYALEHCTRATLMSSSQFYIYFIIFRQKMCNSAGLEKPVLETVLAVLNNLRRDKIKVPNQ